ncbi:hypothetical protein ABT009_28960 [Streptomyces sp. NPDC002896]|uniref:hypothetical protein n=1 Tax=Streptomyces sp. NPDC002896 TaxID=3154438 RepID=UPI00332EF8BE
MTAVAITPRGPFSLAASARFLEGFTPTGYHQAPDGIVRLALPADDGHSTVAAAVWQEETADGIAGRVRAEFTVHPGDAVSPPADPVSARGETGDAVRAQLIRILSLDIDGSGFPALATVDPVVE